MGLFLVMAIPGYLALNLTIDNSHWLPPDDYVEVLSNYVKNSFDQGEELIIAIKLEKEFFSSEVINSLMNLEQSLKKSLPEDQIKHPLNISFLLKKISGNIEITSLLRPYKKKQISLKKMKEVFTDSYYKNRYISSDHKSFLLIIRPTLPKNSLKKELKRSFVHDTVIEILKNNSIFSNFKMAGEIKLNHELNVQNVLELKRLIPLVFIIMIAFLTLWYASLKASLIIAFSAISASFGSFAVISLLNIPLNILTSIVPILVMAIAVSDSIHIINRYIHQKNSQIKELIRFTWKPCLITSLTTAISFISFYGSRLITMKQIAQIGPLSILLAYLLIMGSNSSLLYLLKPQIQPPEHLLQKIFKKLPYKKISIAFPTLIPLLVINCIVIYQFAQTETNMLDSFFKKDASIQQDFAYIDQNHGGTGSFELILGRQNGINFKDIQSYQNILEMKRVLEKISNVKRVESYAMPVEMTHKSLSGQGRHPANTEALAQELLFLEFSQNSQSPDILRPFLSFNAKTARLILRTENLSNQKAEQLKQSLIKSLKIFPQEKEFSGTNQYFLRLGELILNTQINSIIITLMTIFILMGLFYNFKVSFLATVINLIPVCFVMLCIALSKTPFDFSTVLISSICMGLSIDNSIHLVHYISNPGLLLSREAFLTGLRPVTIVGLIFLLVFILFATSNIILLQHFGIFSAIMVLASLSANMFLLPALWGEHRQKIPPSHTI